MANVSSIRQARASRARTCKDINRKAVMSEECGEQKSGEKSLSQRPHVTIYTDGAAEPNPGRGGYGVVLLHPAKRLELSRGFELTTNNRMELLAVIAGLEVLTKPCCVSIHSDSKYVVDAIDKGWVLNWQRKNWKRGKLVPVKNPDLWNRYLEVAAQHTVKMHWVKGHAGHEHNERCDVLAVAAANGAVLEVDHGYQPDSIAVEATDSIMTATDTEITPSENLSAGKIVPSRQSKVTHQEPGEPCRKCGTPVEKSLRGNRRERQDRHITTNGICTVLNAKRCIWWRQRSE